MSSYVIQKQSRGVGAVAAEDLGAVSRASGSPVKARLSARRAPMQARAVALPSPVKARCPAGQSWDKIEQMCRPVTTKALLARRRNMSSMPAAAFVQGKVGRILPPPQKKISPRFRYPQRPLTSTTTGERVGTAAATVPFISRPVGTEPAGVLPGAPPATARPVNVASVRTAAAARHQAQDQALDMGIEEASLQIPQVEEKSNKALIYGGIGLGALALVYLVTRKK